LIKINATASGEGHSIRLKETATYLINRFIEGWKINGAKFISIH
jgi:hypothetical protein